ncbi:MAG: DUF1638 domain-containing protein [Tetrasphaera sp.]
MACGAIALHITEIARRRDWPVDVHPLPPLLHNHPHRIAPEVEDALGDLTAAYGKVIVGYADCGTYGGLDEVCARLGVVRLPGLHCYDLFAGADRIETWLAEQPGTFFLTDFLVRSFDRTVWRELGLDRYPQLRDDYFRHFTRVIWLAQDPGGDLRPDAERVAGLLGLPLTVVATGDGALESALAVALGPWPRLSTTILVDPDQR